MAGIGLRGGAGVVGQCLQPACPLPRYMGPVSANITLVASTVSSVRISITTCPGIQLRMATVTPVEVSEALAPLAPERCSLAMP